MSNAKSPVLAHLSAAIAGLGPFYPHIATPSSYYLCSIYPGVWCSTASEDRIYEKNWSLYQSLEDIL